MLFLLVFSLLLPTAATRSACYDNLGLPQYCEPEFINAAFERPVYVTNTCGAKGPTEYCLQTDITVRQFQNDYTRCEVCDNANALFAHPAKYLTDYNSDARNEETYWQSETMYEGIQHPNSVNLTLDFGKAIEITYIRIKFHSSRPESMQILKRTGPDSEWQAYEYYSSRCNETYGLDPRERISRDNQAICTEDYSDIVPLTGGTLAFVSLRERPSAYRFFQSDVLQEWVTAVAIRIVLNRLNTFSDEVFGDPKVLKSYYYAVSDIAVGGKCKCHGHASSCPKDADGELYCQCQHNTAGRDCDKCLPFYQDLAYQPATQSQPFECRVCECFGHADTCEFDQEAYQMTGRGGRCTFCKNNTQGFHCDSCLPGFYRADGSTPRDPCLPCNCDPVGSLESQCDDQGNCQCYPGVASPKCNRCLPDHYKMTENVGCMPCGCNLAGSQSAVCDPHSGECGCKRNVIGRTCSECRAGFFNMDPSNPLGCQRCFCYGHGESCQSHPSYSPEKVVSQFSSSVEGWQAMDDDGMQYALSISEDGRLEIRSATTSSDAPLATSLKLFAPVKFLGDKRTSYMRFLNFTLWISGAPPPVSQMDDISIEGGPSLQKKYMSWPIHNFNESIWNLLNYQRGYPENHPLELAVSVRLLPESSNDLTVITSLSNLTRLAIRTVYLSPFRVAYLDNVVLEHAVYQASGGGDAPWVELCSCSKEYSGDFCESCAAGFRREMPGGGSSVSCVPCQCHNHSATCNPESGRCDCGENTATDDCSQCKPGFYGDATVATSNDCMRCPCPESGNCSRMFASNAVLTAVPVCHACPKGRTGRLCEICQPGFYMSTTTSGDVECLPCECSGNADPNAILPCDRTTGRCLNCRFDTTGTRCERCLDSFYGDATSRSAPKCHPCGCDPTGSGSANCRNPNGECDCLDNVVGRQCDRCASGFFNMSQTNHGCVACNCNPRGSKTAVCDAVTGICQCQPNTAPPRCDRCMLRHYGFSSEGCKPCDCDPIGSQLPDCDIYTGQCVCKAGDNVIVGLRCDQCAINRYDLRAGCPECPPCYRQVRDSIGRLSVLIDQLRRRLEAIAAGIISGATSLTDDENFTQSIKELEELARGVAQTATRVNEVLDQARGNFEKLRQEFDKLFEEFQEESRRLDMIEKMLNDWSMEGGLSQQLRETNDTLSIRLRMATITLEESKALLRDLKLAAVGDLGEGGNGYGLLADSAHKARALRAELAEQRLKIEQLVSNTTAKFKMTHEAVREMSRSLPDSIGSATLSARDVLRDLEASLSFSKKRVSDFFTDAVPDSDIQTDDTLSMITTAATKFRNASNRLNTEAQLLTVGHGELIEVPTFVYDPRDRIEALDRDSTASMQAASSCATRLNILNKEGKKSRQEADSIFTALDGLRQSAITARENAEKQLDSGQKLLEALWGFSARIDSSKERARGLLDSINSTFLDMSQTKAKLVATNLTITGASRDIRDLAPTKAQTNNVMAMQKASVDLAEEAARLSTLSDGLLESVMVNEQSAAQLGGVVADQRNNFEDMIKDRLVEATTTGEEVMGRMAEAETATRLLAIRLVELEKLVEGAQPGDTSTLPGETTQTLAQLEATLKKLETDLLLNADRRVSNMEYQKRETANGMDESERTIDAGRQELARLEEIVIAALTTPNQQCFLAPAEPT